MRRLSVMFSVIAMSGLLAFGVDTTVASATSTGSISGTVTNTSAVPEANVCVTAYGASSYFTATTDSSGDYTISNLPAASYIVEFDPSCGGTISSPLAVQYYQYEPDIGQAATVGVTTASVPGVNALLQTASSISGTVTNTSAADVQGVCVYLYTSNGIEYVTPKIVTAANGTYTIGNLQDDTYEVRFDPSCLDAVSNSPYAIQFYNGASDYASSTAITFSSPSARSGVNATLVSAGSISGTVSAPGAANNAGICAVAYTASPQSFQNVAFTNASGAYEITNLPPDSYKVGFDPTCKGQITSDFGVDWYNGAASFPAGATETLSTGEALSGLNGTLGLTVSALSISTTSLSSGTLSSAYSATVSATGGTGPYAWTATGLPAGLSIAAGTGVISGTPTASGNFTASITATDNSSPALQTTSSLSLSIASPPPATTTTTTTVPVTETVCSAKTKTVTIHKVEVKNGKKVNVVIHEKVRVYKTVTIKKTEKVHGKKVVVITHKTELVKVCRTVVV